MNAFGFAGWYRQRTPIEFRLAESFDRHWRSLGGQIALDEAQVDEIPDPERFTVKNTATLALQLLKRFRNIRYADYAGRIPPVRRALLLRRPVGATQHALVRDGHPYRDLDIGGH